MQSVAVIFSIISYAPLYCPILPSAIPKPLINVEFVMEMLVLLALVEMESSPLITVQRTKLILSEKMVSAPSVFRAGIPCFEDVLLT